MDLNLLIGLLLVSAVVVGYIVISYKRGAYRRLPNTGDAFCCGFAALTGFAVVSLLVSVFPFQEAMSAYEFTLFVWILINAALALISRYVALYLDVNQRQSADHR